MPSKILYHYVGRNFKSFLQPKFDTIARTRAKLGKIEQVFQHNMKNSVNSERALIGPVNANFPKCCFKKKTLALEKGTTIKYCIYIFIYFNFMD